MLPLLIAILCGLLAAVLYLYTLPSLRRLRVARTSAYQGIVTIADTLAYLRQTGLQGGRWSARRSG